MPEPKRKRGRVLPVDAPEWEPLLNLAPDHVVDFMWMGTIQLTDGTRLQVYKHYWTRDYLHLSEDGRAFVFVPKTRYEEVNPPWLLMRVLGTELDPNLRYSVRHNVWPEDIDRKVYFFGDDLEEVALEVVAAESAEEDFEVIHAMELRKRFHALYEEARSWAK